MYSLSVLINSSVSRALGKNAKEGTQYTSIPSHALTLLGGAAQVELAIDEKPKDMEPIMRWMKEDPENCPWSATNQRDRTCR